MVLTAGSISSGTPSAIRSRSESPENDRLGLRRQRSGGALNGFLDEADIGQGERTVDRIDAHLPLGGPGIGVIVLVDVQPDEDVVLRRPEDDPAIALIDADRTKVLVLGALDGLVVDAGAARVGLELEHELQPLGLHRRRQCGHALDHIVADDNLDVFVHGVWPLRADSTASHQFSASSMTAYPALFQLSAHSICAEVRKTRRACSQRASATR